MSAMFVAVFVLAVFAALLLLALIHSLDRADAADQYRPTARQRAQWKKERLELPKVVAVNRRRP